MDKVSAVKLLTAHTRPQWRVGRPEMETDSRDGASPSSPNALSVDCWADDSNELEMP